MAHILTNTRRLCIATIPVLGNPVLSTIISDSISDQQHAMIETMAITPSLGVHSVAVELEVIVCCIHTNTNGADTIDCVQQGCF